MGYPADVGILLGGKGARTTTFVSPLFVLLLLLTACTAESPTASPSLTTTDADPGTPTPKSQDAVRTPFAAVTLAGVDVDGVNFTVGGFIGEVDEGGGTCTFVLTSVLSNAKVSVATTGVENGATTSCGSAKVPMTELSKGPWTVQLDYKSRTTDVNSPPLKVELP